MKPCKAETKKLPTIPGIAPEYVPYIIDMVEDEGVFYLMKSLECSDDYDTYTVEDMVGHVAGDVQGALTELLLANLDKSWEHFEDEVGDAFHNSFRKMEDLGGEWGPNGFRTTVTYSTEFVVDCFRKLIGLED